MAEMMGELTKQRSSEGDSVSQRKGASVLQDNRGLASSDMRTKAIGQVIQGKTSVKLTSKNYAYDNNTKSSVVGSVAEAYLDPNDPKNGSAPGGGELEGPMEDLKHLGYKSMIKGHLLNGQMGGPGLAQNLFPITSQANSIHKNYVENHIKSYVSHGHPVFYVVEVTDANYSSQSPAAKFTCEAYPWDPNKGEQSSAVDKAHPYLPPIDVESNPEQGTTGSGNAVGINVGTDFFGKKIKQSTYALNSLKFLNNQLASGWGEEGSGKGQHGRDWTYINKL